MTQAAEPISFDVRYDDASLRAGAWVFMSSAAFGPRRALIAIALALCLGGLWFSFMRGEWRFADGFVFAGLLFYPAVLAMGYVLHLRTMRDKVALMKTKGSRVTLREEDIEIVADSGSARFPWRSFARRIERGGVMLLAMSGNQFVTLPLRDTPPTAQEFLRRKIPRLAG
jgi:hypothetical protein